MNPTNLRLLEFREKDEFEIGVDITDDEISEMAEDLLSLRKQLSVIAHIKTDTAEEFDWSVLDKIFNIERQNEELIEEMHNLSTALFDSYLSTGELETIRRRHISFMKDIGSKTT